MCGISGIISNNKGLIEPLLKSMMNSLHHRGPDNSSFYVNNNLGLAHSRLSIIDLDESSNQPLHDYSKRYSIVFNGEILNYRELKDDLLKKGAIFNTSGDTEVLLNGYIYFGLEILKKIRGFYAFCIYDSFKNEMILGRDLFGKKPLYYLNDQKHFLFGSEIKAIISTSNNAPKIDYESLPHFLWKGYYANGDTAYSEIKSILPGQVVKVCTKSLHMEQLVAGNSLKIKVSEDFDDRKIQKVEDALIESIKYRMVSDVPVSFLLSGGVDSSLISYLASDRLSEKIDTHYVGFLEEEFDVFEELAMNVSKKILSNHHVLKMQAPNIGGSLNLMLRVFDEPFGDYSALPSYELYKEISKKTKVAISGDGADEIFCGYKDANFHLLKSYVNKITFQGKSNWLLSKIYKLVNSRYKSIRYGGFLLAMMLLNDQKYSLSAYRGGWNLYHRKDYMTKEGFNILGGDAIEQLEGQDFQNSGDNVMERYLNYDLKRLSYDFLVKIDRTSMANSVEVRSPFLDTNMVNSLNFVKTSNMVDFKNTKKELKFILQSGGLGEITKIPKQGFTPPIGSWLVNKSGQDSIQNMLSNKESIVNKIFQTKKIAHLFSSEILIKQNQSRIWYLLVLDSWHKSLSS